MSREKALRGKEEIITVSFGIVDAEGIDALSVRRVAKELGISSMTTYNYVENLNDMKKEVLIKGFDTLYESIYLALNRLSDPKDTRLFLKTMAKQVYLFAGEHKGVYIFMFTEGQRLFRGDAEVRPFYEFLSNFMKRSKALRADLKSNEKGFALFEMLLFSVALQYSFGAADMSEDTFNGYIDYYLRRFI